MSGSSALNRIDPQQYVDAPLQAAIFYNVANDYINPEGLLSIMKGEAAAAGKGTKLSNLMGAPAAMTNDTRIEPFENVYGQMGDIMGNSQRQMIRGEVEASLMSLTLENYRILYPGVKFTQLYGSDSTKASSSRGTGNAGVKIEADIAGTSGNSISYAQVVSGNSTALSVVVSGQSIVVNVATNGSGTATSTADQVIAAVNGNSAAANLVNASRATGSDGTGVVSASAAGTLTGGVNGTASGAKIQVKPNISLSDYLDNVVLFWSSSDAQIAGAFVLDNALNVNEDVELSFDDDGQAFGVDVTLRAHGGPENVDAETGLPTAAFAHYKWAGSSLTIPA